MNSDIITIIKNISLDTFCISLIVFGLTMLIKLPIKKLTLKLVEEKRKAINTIIIFIPCILCIIVSILYEGITRSNWFSIIAFEKGLSSWLISISLYAIYERIVILFKGIRSGEIKLDSEQAKETINYIKKNIKDLSAKLKSNKKELGKVETKLNSLNEIKNMIETTIGEKDILKFSETNIEIQSLREKELNLKNEISLIQEQIENINQKNL